MAATVVGRDATATTDLLAIIESHVRASNELYGLLLDEALNFDAMLGQLKKCTEFSDLLNGGVGEQQRGQLASRLVGLVQLQDHLIGRLVERLHHTPSASALASPLSPNGAVDVATVACSQVESSVAAVKTRMPHLPDGIIRSSLQATSFDAEQAIELLLRSGLPADPAPLSQESKELWQLRQVFPDVPEATMTVALANTDNDPDMAINLLLVQGAAWAMSPPVQKLATLTATRAGKTASNLAATTWGPVWLNELMPGVPTKDVEAALRATNGNVLKAFKLVKEQQRRLPVAPPKAVASEPKRKDVAAPALPPIDPANHLLQRTPYPPGHIELEREIARRLERAKEGPHDFFKLNTRLMVSTKRRVSQVMATGGLPPREAQIVVGKERLRDRLRCLGLREVPMTDDGNCQFRAFAHQLCGAADQHGAVRQHVIQFMRANPHLYSVYFDGETDYARYLNTMARDKEWGDEMTLKAFADCFGAVVHLVMSTGTRWYHKVAPESAPEDARQIAVCYLSPIHYNAIAVATG